MSRVTRAPDSPLSAPSHARAVPSVADQPWVDELVASLDAGLPLFLACQKIGMSPRTIQRAVLRDPELAAKLRAANGRRAEKLWTQLDGLESYPGEWKKTAWKLEKTIPEFREAKEIPALVDQAVLALIEALEGLMSTSAYNELLDALAELERQRAVAPPAVVVVEGG